MDLQEWELLPNDGFLETHDDGGKKIFSRKFVTSPKNLFIDYFSFQSPNPQKFVDSSSSPSPLPLPSPRGDDSRLPKKQVIPLPIQLEYPIPTPDHDHEEVKLPIVIMGESAPVLNGTGTRAEQESANSQVSFKNLKETQFDDMKIDSPRTAGSCTWGIAPQIETCMFQYEEKKSETSTMDAKFDTVGEKDEMLIEEEEDVIAWGGSNEGHLNLWKWGLSGIGAVCSFGMAAATICIIILGSGQRNKHQKLRFQIYSDEKRMKQVVHHTTNLNEAMTAAMRGVPSYNRAHITYGGYYDAIN